MKRFRFTPMVCQPNSSAVEASVFLPVETMKSKGDQDSNSTPIIGDPFSQSDLHTSQINKLLNIIEEHSVSSLESALSGGLPVNGYGGLFQETPLHKAVQDGWKDGARILMRYGASANALNQFGQSPLHYAAASKSYMETVAIILESKGELILDIQDMRGRTPLHDAAGSGCLDSVEKLLSAGASTSIRDELEETPLHKAINAKNIPCILALLNKGGELTEKNSSKDSALSNILRHIPGGMELLLDYCLATRQTNNKLEISFNFTPLSGRKLKDQMRNLNDIVELGHPKLLLHPVCEGFLLLKWLNVRKLFLIEVIIYFIFAFLASLIIIYQFVYKKNASPEQRRTLDIFRIILIIYTIFILVKQMVTVLQGIMTWSVRLQGCKTWVAMFHSFWKLFSLFHWINFIIPIIVLVIVCEEQTNHIDFQHHFGVIAILLIWAQMMLHIGRFPGSGIYVAMFSRVAKVFLRIFWVFFCLLLGFSLSFFLIMHEGQPESKASSRAENQSDSSSINNSADDASEPYDVYEPFRDPHHAFLKILTMMIGELDFDSTTVRNLIKYSWTGHLIFLAFFIFVSIILSNLLVALAVNDVQGLRNSAHLERLIKQMELVFQFEKTFCHFETIAVKLKLFKFAEFARNRILDLYRSKAHVQPHNPRKDTKIFLKTKGVILVFNTRKAYVNSVLESVRMREDLLASGCSVRKFSMRKRGVVRHARNEYSGGRMTTPNEEYLNALKDMEGNIMDVLAEKVDEMSSTLLGKFEALDKRLHKLESTVQRLIPHTGAIPPTQSEKGVADT